MDIITEPLVSIIVPVYNSKNHLRNTIKSLINQTYNNFEIILIDDGSTDGSSEICDSFKEDYESVVVIHKSNGGICNARNRGMSIARGKYIAFCDNDDIVDSRLLEISVSEAEKEKADVIRFRRRRELVKNGRKITAVYPCFVKEIFTDPTWNDYLKIVNQCGYGIWAGLYNAEYLRKKQIFFDENVKFGYEDHIFVAEACGNANKVVMIPDVLYRWIQRTDGSTSCKKGEKIYNNRVNGIFLWFKKEYDIQKRLNVTEDEINFRKYDYLSCVIDEIRNNNIQRNKAIELLNCEKCRLEYNSEALYKCQKMDMYKRLLCTSIHNNQIKRYCLIQFIHKVLRVLKIT